MGTGQLFVFIPFPPFLCHIRFGDRAVQRNTAERGRNAEGGGSKKQNCAWAVEEVPQIQGEHRFGKTICGRFESAGGSRFFFLPSLRIFQALRCFVGAAAGIGRSNGTPQRGEETQRGAWAGNRIARGRSKRSRRFRANTDLGKQSAVALNLRDAPGFSFSPLCGSSNLCGVLSVPPRGSGGPTEHRREGKKRRGGREQGTELRVGWRRGPADSGRPQIWENNLRSL